MNTYREYQAKLIKSMKLAILCVDLGGSLYKGLNRAAATLAGGGLAVGVHWIASKSGQAGELVVLNGAVFLLG